MGELTRFRMLRSPSDDCGIFPRVHVASPHRRSTLLTDLLEAAGLGADRGPGYAERLAAVAAQAREAGGFDTGGDTTARPARLIDELTSWLGCYPGAEVGALTGWLVALLKWLDFGDVKPDRAFKTVVSAGDWRLLVALLEDRLLLLLVEANVQSLRDKTRVVTSEASDELNRAISRLRVARLVEQVASAALRLTDDVLERFLTCPVVLPSPPFPLLAVSRTAGPPVIADLYVVRDEWARYVAGELAFIENVMPGEERERSTRTTNRNQTVLETETIEVTRRRDETYESERTTEAEESSKQTNLEVGLQFNNDLNVKYGPVENNTQIGASLAFSRSDAQRRATEIARESGRRAVEETEKRIRQLKRQTIETTVQQLDAHRLANTSKAEVRGAYRWVEKVQRYQIFKYPHRLQVEFYLPEPGKFLQQLLDDRKPTSNAIPVPDPLYLTEDGKKDSRPITAEGITKDNYLAWGTNLGVTDLPAPPDEALVVTESLSISGGTRDKQADSYALLPFPPVASGTKDIQLPDGYQAVAWGASAAAAPELALWRDYGDTSDDGVDEKIGYHSMVAAITVGSTNVLIRNRVIT